MTDLIMISKNPGERTYMGASRNIQAAGRNSEQGRLTQIT